MAEETLELASKMVNQHPLGPLDAEISLEDASKEKPDTLEKMWNVVARSCSRKSIVVTPTTERRGWKTIRLFVSSTFRDFHQEREVLVKQVFPDLRLWCESRKLRLVECDLRWGVPADTKAEDTIRICLSELDRCYEENTAPFFLNLAGDRAGWVPLFEDMSANLAAQYGWIQGLSVTEMEIVHGSMRKHNPNALFMIRNAEGAHDIPEELKTHIFQNDLHLKNKLLKLKSIIREKFPDASVTYNVNCRHDKATNKIVFDGLDTLESLFCSTVFEFFKKRIDELYPLDPSPADPLQVQKLEHEAFLLSRSSCVLGRDDIINDVEDYIIYGSPSGAPLVIVGVAGAGKSALMAKCAQNAENLADQGKVTFPNDAICKRKKVFCHFVGATPRSTNLASFLTRLTKELQPDMRETSTDLDSLINLAYNLLQSSNTEPTVVFLDAMNQMDEDKQKYLRRWLPEKLSPNVRVVVSTIDGTASHQTLRLFKTNPEEIVCGPLDQTSREAIVTNIFKTYNKRLGNDQMKLFLSKGGSKYPLWLSLACEELRVFGVFEQVTEKIKHLPDELIDLEESVFERFEGQAGGDLMKACICMLEVSRHGLLETELLELLAHKEKLILTDSSKEEAEILDIRVMNSAKKMQDTREIAGKDVEEAYVKKKQQEKEDNTKKMDKRNRGKVIPHIFARDWAIIYRNLKPLLRPCGNLGEGRLDFYHRSLSKATRKRYFDGKDEVKQRKYNFWHGVLADYFESVQDLDRKAEELPYHLEKLMDINRLVQCLMDWNIFERMYNEDFSADLLHSWQQCGGFGIATSVYKEQLAILRSSGDMPLVEYVEWLEKVYGFFIQAGKYPEALELMEERLKDELQSLGQRPDKLADVYYAMARCKSEILKAETDYGDSEDCRTIVEYCLKSIEYRKDDVSDDNDYKCGLAYIILGFQYIDIANIHWKDPECDTDALRLQAHEAIEEAETKFRNLNDMGHVAECSMTKALIESSREAPLEVMEPLFLEALDLCRKAYGERHVLLRRITANLASIYDYHNEHDKAFEYYIKTRDTDLQLFGPGHPKTLRTRLELTKEPYASMMNLKEQSVSETA